MLPQAHSKMSPPAADTAFATIHLLSLSTPLPNFLVSVAALQPQPLTVAKVEAWVHPPEFISVDSLIADKTWDVLLVLRGAGEIPKSLKATVKASWSITAQVSSSMIENFREMNKTMLHPQPEDIPKLHPQIAGGNTVPSQDQSQPLAFQVSPELDAWFRSFTTTNGAGTVSMFNLLSYANKEKYMEYIEAFGESLTPQYGGTPTILGQVVATSGEGNLWDDVAIVQYPSIAHFANMLASEDYAAIDRKHKDGALKDTGILCVVELDLKD